MRITKANLEALRAAMSEVTDAWDNISDDVETWLDLHNLTTLTDDEREDKVYSRDCVESGLSDLHYAVSIVMKLWND